MIYLNYIPGWETPRKISEKLEEIYGDGFQDLTQDYNTDRFYRNDVLINYGTSSGEYETEIRNAGGRILNSGSSIRNNCNKLTIFEALKRLNLNVPKIWRRKQEITKFPVIGRNLHHQAANDVVIIHGNQGRIDFDSIPNKDYYIELIPDTTEFRVYIFKDKAFKVFKKVFTGRDIKTNRRDIPMQSEIKNDSYGWEFQTINNVNSITNWSEIYDACKRTLKEIKMEFGAFDLIRDRNNQIFILELNSGAWQGEETMESFVQCLKQEIGEIRQPVFSGRKSLFWN